MPRAVFLVTDILADNNARARTFGLASALATRGFAAVKTGTSKDMRDNWCIGFTDRYTIGVWVGNASGEAMHDVSGVSGAAPVWQALARYLHASAPSRPPAAPAGVVARARRVRRAALEPARDEVFIAGTRAGAQARAPQRFARAALRHRQPAATAASSRSIPTCRRRRRRITFEGEHGTWVLDGKRLGAGAALRWAPWPGRHELTLVDGQRQGAAERALRGARRGRESSRRLPANVDAMRRRASLRLAPDDRRRETFDRDVDTRRKAGACARSTAATKIAGAR